MVRSNVSHYQLLEEVGAGGMGVIYRARDDRLERIVALKVLPPGSFSDESSRKRFRKEALALSHLSHPNIATIFDIGTSPDGMDFLVMEYVPGVSLDEKIVSGPLPEKELIGLGVQLADALEAAHQRGIVHRDLKPANLRVTPEGRLKVLDFGLAKSFQHNASAPTESATVEGISGTLPYMAPEQINGERVDGRSDIYAAGATLYELATTQRAFPDAFPAALVNAVLNTPPVPPRRRNARISTGLENIILKALEKDPERRYQSAREMRVDLERLKAPTVLPPPRRRPVHLRVPLWAGVAILAALLLLAAAWYLRGRASPGIDSVAVLPFTNASTTADADYLADGLAESLIDRLSRLPNVKVISRASVFRYKGKQVDPKLVARDLGVRAVVAGVVTQRGNDVYISTELVDARDDSRLWGDEYTRKLSEITGLQSDIASHIVSKLGARISGSQQAQLTHDDTTDSQAYQLYLRGRYSAELWTPATIAKAREFYQAALARDPNYARAYAALADSYRFPDLPPQQRMALARTYATKAVQIDDSLGEAHASLALVRFLGDWDWEGAEQEFKRALQLSPATAEIHHMYSHYLLAMGRVPESLTQSQRALELDPVSRAMNVHLGYHYLCAHELDKAIQQYEKTVAMFPDAAETHDQLSMAYQLSGNYSQAVAEFLKSMELQHDKPEWIEAMREAYRTSGIRGFWRKHVWVLEQQSQQSFIGQTYFAIGYALSGDDDHAFQALDMAYHDHETDLAEAKSEPRLVTLHNDPRWVELLRRMKLP